MRAALSAFAAMIMTAGGAARAAEPQDGGLGLQPAASPVMEDIHFFHNVLLMPIITAISVFVLALLLWVALRYNSRANPNPRTFTHNTFIEVVWTGVPILILVVIGFFSFPLLYKAEASPEASVTVKAVGYQWAWRYEYPDHGNFSYDSLMIPDDEIDASAGQKRLLSTDAPLVVPVGEVVRVLVTADDVLHSFALPAFGVKVDAVPGRLNETWFQAQREGTYYGQCSELCGTGHAFMPIEIEVVSREAFESWVTRQQAQAGLSQPAQTG